MSEWSSGYNVDVGYTFGVYRELAPRWLDFVALARGVPPPSGAWRYLELGCGQGVGLAMLAACHPEHEFVGIDFNPSHVAHGRSLAAAAGLTNVRFEEADFVELARAWPSDWGRFDYVTAHGIYSWLAKSVRQALAGMLEHATAPGALVYLSYNSLPGWLSTMPVQHLLRLWQTTEEMPSVKAMDVGIERLIALTGGNSAMTRVLPSIIDRLNQIGHLDRAYLVQEYLHDNWHPLWFDEVARELAGSKLSFVGTATIGDLYLWSVLPEAHRKLLAPYENQIVREVMTDVVLNQGFRRDVFARGYSPLWAAQQRALLLEQRLVLVNKPSLDSEITIRLSVGEVTGKKEVYHPLFAALSDGPKSIGELLATAPGQRSFGDTVEATAMMLHAGHVALDNPIADPTAAKALNRVIARATAAGAPYRNLIASTSSIIVSALDTQMMMLSVLLEHPEADADLLAQRLLDILPTLGKTLMHDGKPVQDPGALKAQAARLAREFLEATLPEWKRIGVV